MSIIWSDEYDPSELDGFQVETELDWRIQGDTDFDAADAWLANQQYNTDNNLDTEGIEPNEVR